MVRGAAVGVVVVVAGLSVLAVGVAATAHHLVHQVFHIVVRRHVHDDFVFRVLRRRRVGRRRLGRRVRLPVRRGRGWLCCCLRDGLDPRLDALHAPDAPSESLGNHVDVLGIVYCGAGTSGGDFLVAVNFDVNFLGVCCAGFGVLGLHPIVTDTRDHTDP